MDINATLAQRAYGQKLAQRTTSDPQAAPDFVQLAQSFAETVKNGETQAQAALTTGADPHTLVTAMAETKLAVETAVTVRDRVVEAYQEILRMQI